VKASPERDRTTPSSTVETDGSAAMEKLIVPTPRKNSDWFSEVPDLRKFSVGTRYWADSMLIPPWASMASPPTTEMAMGTSWRRSSRFWAVTMISLTAGSSAGGVAVCAKAGPAAPISRAARATERCSWLRWRASRVML
jgi:hypothetical protein